MVLSKWHRTSESSGCHYLWAVFFPSGQVSMDGLRALLRLLPSLLLAEEYDELYYISDYNKKAHCRCQRIAWIRHYIVVIHFVDMKEPKAPKISRLHGPLWRRHDAIIVWSFLRMGAALEKSPVFCVMYDTLILCSGRGGNVFRVLPLVPSRVEISDTLLWNDMKVMLPVRAV